MLMGYFSVLWQPESSEVKTSLSSHQPVCLLPLQSLAPTELLYEAAQGRAQTEVLQRSVTAFFLILHFAKFQCLFKTDSATEHLNK